MLPLVLIALTAVPVEADMTEARARVRSQIRQVDAAYTELGRFLESRFASDTERPSAGMSVVSMPDPGPDGLHPTVVVMVFRGGPADQAGINPGDRILVIGRRRIEHEPTALVRDLLEGKAGPLEVTVARADGEHRMTINRRPLACLAKAADGVDTKHWLDGVAKVREALTQMNRDLDARPDDAAVLGHIARQTVDLAELLPQVTGVIGSKLSALTLQYCDPRYE